VSDRLRLNCPPIRPSQLVIGYAAQLAAHFQCSGAREFCSDFDISFLWLARGREAEIERFAVLTGNDSDVLRAHSTIHLPDGTFSLNGQILARHVTKRSSVHICCECAAEDIAAYPHVSPDVAVVWRRDWIVSCVDTCERHSRPQVEVSRIMGSSGQWDATLAWYGISHDLPSLLASPIRREPHQLQRYAVGRIDHRADSVAILDAMPLHAVISLCAKFGHLATGALRPWNQLDEQSQHLAYKEGFHVLSRGQEGINELLWRRLALVQETHARNIIGANSLLKHVHTHLTVTRDDPAFEPVRVATANAVYDVLPFGPEDDPLFGVPCTFRRSYSVSEASRRFGLTEKTFKAYAEVAGVTMPFENGNGRVWVDAARADAFFGDSGGFINLASVEEETGARKPSLDAFADAGLLRPISIAASRQRNHRPVRKNDVAALMQAFRDRAVPVAIPPENSVALVDLHRHLRDGLAAVHALALNGEIWLGRVEGPKPYASLLIDLEEVRSHLATRDPEMMDLRAAAEVAEIHCEILNKLAAAGLVPSQKILNRTTGLRKRHYLRMDMERFASEHIALLPLARSLKASPRGLRRQLDQLEVKAAFDQDVGATIYRRSDLIGAGVLTA
jgi:hypothetical protein